MPKARLEIWNPSNTTKLGDLWTVDGNGNQRNFDDIDATGFKLNEFGSGGVTIQQDHPNAALLTAGNVVRLCAGSTPVYAWRIASKTAKNITGKHVERVIEPKGFGLWKDWYWSIVGPWHYGRPISVDRVFNWASPPLNTSSWMTQLFLQDRTGTTPGWPRAMPIAPLFAAWVWSRSTSASQPVGSSLFRRPFTLDADKMIGVYVAGDNAFEVWIDGVLLERNSSVDPDTSSWEETWRVAIPLTAGSHHLGIKVDNWGAWASLLAAAFTVTTAGLDEPLFSTNAEPAGGWLGLDYPNPLPGFTAPQILQLLLTEAQARGELTGWSLTTHGTHSQIPEFPTRVGARYTDVIDALTATYLDVEADTSGLNLHLYPKDGLGSATSVVVDVKELATISDGEIVNAVLGVWADGVRWRQDAGSISTYGRFADSVSLGSMTDLVAVDEALDAYLAANAYPTVSVVGEVVDATGKTAGVDYGVGDTLTVAGETQRCSGLTWTVKRNGDLVPMPEWESPVLIRRRERERAYERQIAMFDSPASSAILSKDPLTLIGRPASDEWTWSWSDDIEDALNEVDPDKPWQVKQVDHTQRLWEFSIECDPNDLPDAWGDTIVTIMKDGVELHTAYRVKLTTVKARDALQIWGYETVFAGDRIQVACIEAGGHVDGAITLKRADTP